MTGTCKYCGQVRETFVPEEIEKTQENLDRLATEQCDCEKAGKERAKRQAAERSKDTLGKMLSRWPEAAEEAKTLVDLVSKGELEAVTLKVPASTTVKISENSKGNIVVNKTTTIQERHEL